MKYIFIIIFISIGIGIPIIYTINTSSPKNLLNRIIKELKLNPKELWYLYFTKKGLEKWFESGFKIDELENLQILEYKYNDFTWNYKIKTCFSNEDKYYIIKLVKFPDIRVKSRWIINNISRL